MNKLGKGVQVRGVMLRSSEDPRETAVQITVWPLPDDEELHQALNDVCREAVNAELTRRRITAGTWSDLKGKGHPGGH